MQGIELTEPQSEVYEDLTRFRVLVAGRRFGKSFLSGIELLRAAIAPGVKKQTVIYIAPSFAMCKQIMWVWLMEYAPKTYIKRKNKTELTIEFKNGSKIMLKSSENYDSLRGLSLSFVVLDEVADIPAECWNLVVRPALSDQEGGALFIGTPKGAGGFFHTKYLDGKSSSMPNWNNHKYTTIDGGQVSASEIEDAKRDLSLSDFNQEYMASFECLNDRVYPDFEDANITVVKDNGTEVHIGLDFNGRKMTSVCANTGKDWLNVFDLITLTNTNTHKMADAIEKRFPGRDIFIHPDPSGKAKSTKAQSGVTDHTILRDRGFTVVAEKHIKIKDRLNSVNTLICNAKGDRNLMIDKGCLALNKALKLHQWDLKRNEPDKHTEDHIDDINDSLGYLVYGLHRIRSNVKFERW